MLVLDVPDEYDPGHAELEEVLIPKLQALIEELDGVDSATRYLDLLGLCALRCRRWPAANLIRRTLALLCR